MFLDMVAEPGLYVPIKGTAYIFAESDWGWKSTFKRL